MIRQLEDRIKDEHVQTNRQRSTHGQGKPQADAKTNSHLRGIVGSNVGDHGSNMIDGGCILDPGTMGTAPINTRRMRSTEFSSMIEVIRSAGAWNAGLYELDH